MALDIVSLADGLRDLMDASEGKTLEESRDYIAAQTANLIDAFVKSGTVNTTVTVTTPDTINGGGTGTGAVT
jgi:hypothetical protein